MLGMGLDLLMGRKPRVSRSRTRTAETRLRKAEDKIESARRAYEDLTLDLEDEIRAIQAEADQALDDIETITIGLEKDDIRTTDIRVFWLRR